MPARGILFAHSAGPQGPRRGSGPLVARLRRALGRDAIAFPKMPHPNRPALEPWKARLRRELRAFDAPVILLGHSFGGSVLVKLLSEERIDRALAGLVLVATPWWGNGGWQYEAFRPKSGFAKRLPRALPIVRVLSRLQGA